jgi:hypothetical protein
METGTWGRDGSTVHAFKTYGGAIGFDGGTGTGRHRAEMTPSDPPEMHGHPLIS